MWADLLLLYQTAAVMTCNSDLLQLLRVFMPFLPEQFASATVSDRGVYLLLPLPSVAIVPGASRADS